ncbi:MAG: VCBS repeat-containing protein [Anaerolineaceae bacterium]|nr:VCBS repeat-containing protein [Anaerolineaceae bacterium]
MTFLTQFALWLYALLLRLYPRYYREEFGEEVTAVFQQHLQQAAASSPREALAVIGRELRDWPLSCLREHARERNRLLMLPRPLFLSGRGAVAAGVPFLFSLVGFGLIFIFIPNVSRFTPLFFLAGGVLVAWWRRWPGWVVSWLGLLIFYGQNWLPYSFFTTEPAWNSVPRLLNNLSQVAIQVGWLLVMYWVVRRWPRHGTLVFLQFLLMPWWFSLEFVSEAITAVIFSVITLFLAGTAIAIARQRTLSGDLWLMFGAALLPGALLSWGGQFFGPGMDNAMRSVLPQLLEALAPFLIIILLQTLNAWGQENGRTTHRLTRTIAVSTWVAFFAILALQRVVGPSDLEAFQLGGTPVLIGLWLLGVVVLLISVWRLRLASLPRPVLAFYGLMLLLLPVLQRPANLTYMARSMSYNKPALSDIAALIPTFETADFITFNLGIVGVVLLPWMVGRVRQQTVAFPKFPEPTGWQAWRQRRQARREARPAIDSRARRKRIVGLLLGGSLLAGCVGFLAVFLPLQLEAEPYTRQVALGDVDSDGDLDVLLANTRRIVPIADNVLLLNDGNGRFTPSGQPVGSGSTSALILDINGNGDLDIVLGGMGGVAVYGKRGDGRTFGLRFLVSALQAPESGINTAFFQVGDLNGDGLMDVFVAGCCGMGISNDPAPGQMRWVPSANRVLFGSEERLVDSGQALGTAGSEAIDLGDLDGDGDIDAFVGNTQDNGEELVNNLPNDVWLNDGRGQFSDSGQKLGQQRTYAVALGDVDGDGDLDALVGNEGADELWLNDGSGRFTLSTQSWSPRRTLTAALVDLDGDGDLDALTGHELTTGFAWWRQGIIWWNDGYGRFTEGDQKIHYRPNGALAVGDVNGDSLPDIVVGELDEVKVWLNEGNGRFVPTPSFDG